MSTAPQTFPALTVSTNHVRDSVEGESVTQAPSVRAVAEALALRVRKVNGVGPDADGNVETAGGGSVTDASASAQGVVRLAGALGGTADAPTALGFANAAALTAALALLAPRSSPAFTGAPTAPTAAPGTNTDQLASTAFVQSAVAALLGSAPEMLATLEGLADALGDDANFAATVTQALSGKQPTLTALDEVPGLTSALAGKQTAHATLTDLASRTIGAASETSILARSDADARYVRFFSSMPDASVGRDGDCGVLLSGGQLSLIARIDGAWSDGAETSTATRMAATGTFRNGPGRYSGLTVVYGSGAISVYDGPDATELGALVHSIPAASPGAYPLAEVVITNGWIVLDPGIVVDIDVDD